MDSTHTHKACCMNARGSDVSTPVFVSFDIVPD